MQAKNGSGCTQEPPHQEMDRKELQPPTPPGLEQEEKMRGEERGQERRGEEKQSKTIEETMGRQGGEIVKDKE